MDSSARILIVEDEMIVASDLQTSLRRLGYSVEDIATTGEEAVEKAAATLPDLLLVDIKLKGSMNGIDAARRINEHREVPIVYLSAFSDKATLDRAKTTEPYGYLVKPFNTQELGTTLETALHKHAMDRKRKEREQWLSATFENVGDGLIVTDLEGRVRLMNPIAEKETGWNQSEALSRPVSEVFQAASESTGQPVADLAMKAIREGSCQSIEQAILSAHQSGSETPVTIGAAPIRDTSKTICGAVLTFHDMTGFRRMEEDFRSARQRLEKEVAERTEALAGSEFSLERATVDRDQAEISMTKAFDILKAEQQNSADKGTALREVLSHMDCEQQKLATYFQSNVHRVVMPLLRRLEAKVGPTAKDTISQLESSLVSIMSPFVNRLESSFATLSPREVEICTLIENGLGTKEIAASLNTSFQTVRHQRKAIRRKLGISNDSANLRSFLKTI